ncbi:hypothetical protein D3C72_1123160 [compost metagenome]
MSCSIAVIGYNDLGIGAVLYGGYIQFCHIIIRQYPFVDYGNRIRVNVLPDNFAVIPLVGIAPTGQYQVVCTVGTFNIEQ